MQTSAEVATRAPASASPLLRALGWILAAIAIAYTVFIHQGLAVPPNGMVTEWWHATGFLRDWESVGSWLDRPRFGIVMLSLPAALLTLLVFLSTPSAIARTAAISSTVTVSIMSFYGLSSALRIWEFFHWRGSLVIVLTGLAVGCTLGAPWLAGSWLRLKGRWKLVTYLPVFFAVASIMRNATGTDEDLFFNVSPWPAIPVLGLDIGSYTIVGLMIGLAVGLAILSREEQAPARKVLGFAIGAVIPLLWFDYRFPHTEVRILVVGLALCALILALALVTRSSGRRQELRRRAAHLAAGAALVALPLLSGGVLADADHARIRNVQAEALIEALSRYYHDEYEHPESLEALVEGGYLDEIPEPRIGFQIYYALGWLDPLGFEYRNLGSSYVLEFSSTEWVTCLYNPPWEPIEGEEEEEEEEVSPEESQARLETCLAECQEVCEYDCDEDDTGECSAECAEACAERCGVGEVEEDPETEEGWSCPDKRPDLW